MQVPVFETNDLFEPVGGVSVKTQPHRDDRGGKVQARVDDTPAGRHLRLAMRTATRMRQVRRRDLAARMICHHLQCMLDARDGHASAGSR